MYVPTVVFVMLSNNQAAVIALSFKVLISNTVYKCRRLPNEFSERCNVCVIWVLGQSDIPENCKMVEFAKFGANIQLSNEFTTVDISLGPSGL